MKDEVGYNYEVGYMDALRCTIHWMLNNQATFESWEIYSGKLLEWLTEARKEQDRIILKMEDDEE